MAAVNVDGETRIIDYSVQDNATPLDPGNTGSAMGIVDYVTTVDSKRLDDEVELKDPDRSLSVPGVVTNLSRTDGLVSVSTESALYAMNKWLRVKPYSGNLNNYMHYLSTLCGVSPRILVDSAVTELSVVAIGYFGNVWEGFKEFLAANNLEAVYHTGRVRVRRPQTTVMTPERLTSLTQTHTNMVTSDLVRVKIRELMYPTIKNNIELYPDKDNFSEGILSVDAGEVVVHQITIDGSVETVNPEPECRHPDKIKNPFGSANNTGGYYTVAGNDGLPIDPDRWAAGGGRLFVRTTNDPSVIEVIIHGSRIKEYAPYQIAMASGPSTFYNSLYITGRGLRWRERELEVATGAKNNSTDGETVTEIDNRHILTLVQGYDAALRASQALCGGAQTYSGASAPDGPEAGTRVRLGDAVFRASSVTKGPHGTQFNLDQYTTVADFNAAHSGRTIAQFNSRFSGDRFLDFNERPLK